MDEVDEANPTVMVIQQLGEKSIQANIDKRHILRHIKVSSSRRLLSLIRPCRHPVTVNRPVEFFFFSPHMEDVRMQDVL